MILQYYNQSVIDLLEKLTKRCFLSYADKPRRYELINQRTFSDANLFECSGAK